MNIISSIKVNAIKLRREGKSYNEINKKLHVPKSTLSGWFKADSRFTRIKEQNISNIKKVWAENIIKYNKFRSERYKITTQKLIDSYAREVPKISNRNLFLIGVALFWAEGGKREKWTIRFCNSDPEMIQVIMKFFRKICNVPDEKFILNIHLHPNISENKAIKFWSKSTELAINQFRKSQIQISRSSQGKRPIHRLPYGTLHIRINDANLNKKLKGWLKGVVNRINNVPG